MPEIEVEVVPVAVRFAVDGEPEAWLKPAGVAARRPAFLGFAPTEGWARTQLGQGETPTLAAERLLQSMAPRLLAHPLMPQPRLEPVAFIESGTSAGPISLVFTAAVPTSATEIPPASDWQWVDMHSETAAQLEPSETRSLVREHWRQALEQTTAAERLLPEYFTLGQILDVYRAVWQLPRTDWGNFRRWLTDRNPGIVEVVSPEEVVKARDRELSAIAIAGGMTGAAAARAFGLRTATGASLAAVPLSFGALAPAAAVGIAAVAGAVAYQRLQRGKQPDSWYRFTGEGPELLEVFHPRPAWRAP